MREVGDGALAPIDALVNLSPAPAVMDIFMWQVLRAHAGDRAPIPLSGEGGLLSIVKASSNVAKAKQNIGKRFDRVRAEVWQDAPYVFNEDNDVVECKDDVDPGVALARLVGTHRGDMDPAVSGTGPGRGSLVTQGRRPRAVRVVRGLATSKEDVRETSSGNVNKRQPTTRRGDNSLATPETGPWSRGIGLPLEENSALQMAVARVLADQALRQASTAAALQLEQSRIGDENASREEPSNDERSKEDAPSEAQPHAAETAANERGGEPMDDEPEPPRSRSAIIGE